MTWEDIDGWFDFRTYYKSVVENYPGGVLVEVGCYLGRSLCCLGQLVRDSGKPFHVVGVDTCTGSGVENNHDHHGPTVEAGGGTMAGQLHRNVLACGLGDVVTLIVADSRRASTLFTDKSLTMVFLDAAHDYRSVERDILAWLPKVRSGGEIGGDDFGTPDQPDHERVWPDVKRAVEMYCTGYECVPHDAWKYRTR